MSFTNAMMRQAIGQAQEANAKGCVPVGAIVTRGETILAAAHNLHRPLEHAELLAIGGAQAALGHGDLQDYLQGDLQGYLQDCSLFVTLEPCAMCAGAMALARIGRVYFGAYDPKSGGTDHGARVFDHPQCHWKPEVYGGICETECAALLTDFFAKRR